MAKNSASYTTNISLDPLVAQKLKDIAKLDERSLASLMRKVLTDYANNFSFPQNKDNFIASKENTNMQKIKIPPLKK